MPATRPRPRSYGALVKSGFGGEHTESNHRLMYTWACASPQKWRAPLQPYAEHLADHREIEIVNGTPSTCPLCGCKPIVGVLRSEGDGAKKCAEERVLRKKRGLKTVWVYWCMGLCARVVAKSGDCPVRSQPTGRGTLVRSFLSKKNLKN